MKAKNIPEVLFLLIIIILVVLASLSQTLVYIWDTPQGFVFPFPHNYIEDYYYYLHLMRQGYDGMWLATSRLTPENFEPQFVNPFFLLLGHLARIFHLSLQGMYTLARALGGAGIVFLSYLLVSRANPDSFYKRITALIIVFLGSYIWTWSGGGPGVAQLVHEWTELDPLFRISYIPHHLWSKVFMLGTFVIMLKAWEGENKSFVLFAVVTTLVMGFISPVVLATFVPVVSFWFIYIVLTERKKAFRIFSLTLFCSVLITAVGVAVYHRVVQNEVFPWTSYLWWEKVQYQVTVKNYIQSLGVNFILFIFATPLLIRLRFTGGLLLAWALTSFVTLFILAPYIPLTNSRYLGGYQFIPIGIGTCALLFSFSSYLYQRVNTLARYIVPLCFIILFIYNGVGFIASWKEHKGYINQNRWNMQVYVPVDLWSSFKFLNEKSHGDVVVAPLEISTMIPAFSGSKTISGHKTITYEYDKKNQELAYFYSGSNPEWAKDFFYRYNVKYVLAYYPDAAAQKWYNSLGLTKVYNNQSVWIYTNP